MPRLFWVQASPDETYPPNPHCTHFPEQKNKQRKKIVLRFSAKEKRKRKEIKKKREKRRRRKRMHVRKVTRGGRGEGGRMERETGRKMGTLLPRCLPSPPSSHSPRRSGPGTVPAGLLQGELTKRTGHRTPAGHYNRLGLSPEVEFKFNAKFRFPKGWD